MDHLIWKMIDIRCMFNVHIDFNLNICIFMSTNILLFAQKKKKKRKNIFCHKRYSRIFKVFPWQVLLTKRFFLLNISKIFS